MKKQDLQKISIRKRFLGKATAFAMALSLSLEGMPLPSAQAAPEAINAGEVDLTSESYDKTETKYVYDFMDLYLALGLEGNFYVKVMKDIEETWTEELKTYLLQVHGDKVLDLNGHNLIFNDEFKGEWHYESRHTLCRISEGASLTIYDGAGSEDWDDARIWYDGYIYSEDYPNGRNLFDVYGTLTLNGGTLQAGRMKEVWCTYMEDDDTEEYYGTGYAYAMIHGYVARVYDGGTFVMNGGRADGHVEPSYKTIDNVFIDFIENVIDVRKGGHAYINGGIVEGYGEGSLIHWEDPEDGKNCIAAGVFKTGDAMIERIYVIPTFSLDSVEKHAATKLGFDESNIADDAMVLGDALTDESADVALVPKKKGSSQLYATGELVEGEQSGQSYYLMDFQNAKLSVSGLKQYFTGAVEEQPGLNYKRKLTWGIKYVKDGQECLEIFNTPISQTTLDVTRDIPGFLPEEGVIYEVQCVMEEKLGFLKHETRSNIVYFSVQSSSGQGNMVSSVKLDKEHFPDDNFRTYLSEQFDKNHDGTLNADEIKEVKTLHVGGTNDFQIETLDGIQYLPFVTAVYAYENHNLHSFDGTGLPYLMELDLERCPIDTLNVSNNKDLYLLNLTGINDYDVRGTLEEIDVSNCTWLRRLYLRRSGISNLDVSKNLYLVRAALYGTKEEFAPANYDMYSQYVHEDAVFTYENGDYVIVAHLDEKTFPDNAFRSYAASLADKNNDGKLALWELKNVTAMDCSDLNVQNLKGIELFPELETFVADYNELTSVDLSQNKKMHYLSLISCGLTDLDVSALTELESLYANNNESLGRVDLTNNKALQDASLIESGVTEISVYGLSNLQSLDVSYNRLTNLDVRSCTSLVSLYAQGNRLRTIDVTRNTGLTTLYLANNALEELNVSKNLDLTCLTIYGNQGLKQIDISNNATIKDAYLNGVEVNQTDSETGERYIAYRRQGSNVNLLSVSGTTIVYADQMMLTVNSDMMKNLTIEEGDPVTLSVVAYGDGLTYLWYYNFPGEFDGYAPTNCTESTITVNPEDDLYRDGVMLYCHVEDERGNYQDTGVVTVTIQPKQAESVIEITKQPRNWYGEKYGVKASFDVEAIGEELTYQWQYKKGSGDWTDWGIATADTANLKASLSEKTEKYEIRCKITDKYGKEEYSNVVKMMLAENNPIKIEAQPKNYYNAVSGKKASFDVVATGENLHYQWQWDKGGTWQDYAIATADTPNFKVSVNDTTLKRKYRCEITDDEGNWVDTVAVKISQEADPGNGSGWNGAIPFVITKQPVDWFGAYGKKASFSVEAEGDGELTYQWQYKKSGSWTDYAITTADTPNFKVTMNEKNVKWPIRCLITAADGRTITTNEVWMKLEADEPEPEPQPEPGPAEGPVITSQPADWVGMIGKKASFSVTATGKGLSYQWQYKKGTADWTNYAIATADTANFQVSMNEKNVKWTFRCVITDMDGKTAVTNEVHMYIKGQEPQPDPGQEGPVITGQPGDYTGRIGKKATFNVTATGEGLTYEWQVKKTGGWSAYTLAGYNTPTFQVSINDKTAAWTYRCVIRDAAGHEVATNEVHIVVAE